MTKKRIRDIVLAIIILAMICFIFWSNSWLSSWKEVTFLYVLLAIGIAISIVTDAIKRKFRSSKDKLPSGFCPCLP